MSVTSAGTGYKNPRIVIPEPVYENMEVVGVSRLGVGATTETGRNVLVNLTIGQTTEKALGDRFFDAANLIEANTALIADVAYGNLFCFQDVSLDPFISMRFLIGSFHFIEIYQ